ncbi:DNA-binding NarL/FixJ family response regulator [Pedobacter sp. UYEF25]
MLKILLAEDHVIVRDGIKALLQSQFGVQVIGDAANGKELIDMIGNGLIPDMVLTDLNMPEMDGISLIKELKLRWPDIKIMVLSMLDNEKYVAQAFSEGCLGYLLKNVGPEEMMFAIKTVESGTKYLCNELSEKLIEKLIEDLNFLSDQTYKHVELTSREIEVLYLIAEGYTNNEMADKLFLSKRTIEGHRQTLIDKTGSKNTASLINFAVMNGFLKQPIS